MFGVCLRGDEQYVFGDAGTQESLGCCEAIDVSRAAEVVVKGSGRCRDAKPVLYDAGRRRQQIVRALGAKQDKVYRLRRDAVFIEKILRRLDRHVGDKFRSGNGTELDARLAVYLGGCPRRSRVEGFKSFVGQSI